MCGIPLNLQFRYIMNQIYNVTTLAKYANIEIRAYINNE